MVLAIVKAQLIHQLVASHCSDPSNSIDNWLKIHKIHFAPQI